jgi:hypothetical protein
MPMPSPWTTTKTSFDTQQITVDFFDHSPKTNSRQEVVDNLMTDEKVEEDTAAIKESLILEPTGYPVEAYVIAYAANGRRNNCKRIPCKKTKPLGSWCYDLATDQFLVDCAGFLHLGRFPIGYRARMKGIEGWAADMPLSLSIIENRISPQCKELFDEFKKNYPEESYNHSYIQCTGVFNGE